MVLCCCHHRHKVTRNMGVKSSEQSAAPSHPVDSLADKKGSQQLQTREATVASRILPRTAKTRSAVKQQCKAARQGNCSKYWQAGYKAGCKN